MALNLDELLIQIVVNIVILAPILWLSGRALVAESKIHRCHLDNYSWNNNQHSIQFPVFRCYCLNNLVDNPLRFSEALL